jgi:hypothetical protein
VSGRRTSAMPDLFGAIFHAKAAGSE